MRGLKGKVSVVTGGSRGIGSACVQRLLEEGGKALFTGRDPQKGAKTLKEFQDKFGVENVGFIAGDMKDEAFCKKIIATALKNFGKLDYLVNNAFSFISKGLDATREDWLLMFETGPIAYATMIQEYVKQRGMGPGAIVNMSSISAHIAQPNRWTYNSAKGAVTQLTKCAAFDLAPNIRVNRISPAWVWTDRLDSTMPDDGGREKWGAIWGKFHLLRRVSNPEETAAGVAFLLSDDASFMTGSDLYVDGGYLVMGGEGLGEGSKFARKV
jgi:NAD(P)-dependent dehydrogenase (short-subunit alcohol dehydrogenase family)